MPSCHHLVSCLIIWFWASSFRTLRTGAWVNECVASEGGVASSCWSNLSRGFLVLLPSPSLIFFAVSKVFSSAACVGIPSSNLAVV